MRQVCILIQKNYMMLIRQLWFKRSKGCNVVFAAVLQATYHSLEWIIVKLLRFKTFNIESSVLILKLTISDQNSLIEHWGISTLWHVRIHFKVTGTSWVITKKRKIVNRCVTIVLFQTCLKRKERFTALNHNSLIDKTLTCHLKDLKL